MKIFKDEKINVLNNEMQSYVTDTGCLIFIGKEEGLYHMSISHKDRYPTWDEIKQARYDLLSKSKTFAMLLPPEKEYVNIHPNCFHLYEIKEGLS